MGFKSDGPAYTHIQCPGCGKAQTIASFKINGMFWDRRVAIKEWTYPWLGAQMRCTSCGTKGMTLTAR